MRSILALALVGSGLIAGAAARAEDTSHERAGAGAAPEAAAHEACGERVQSLYADLGKRVARTVAFIEENKQGGWKMLNNHAKPFLQELETPGFVRDGNLTRIIDFRARWRRRYEGITATTPFAL